MNTHNLDTKAAMQKVNNHFTGNDSMSKDEFIAVINSEVKPNL